jgi:osmoprotectant transport system substrate-binding protein
MRWHSVAGPLVVAGLVLAACGGDDESADLDFGGVEIIVGSKNFTEQHVLSEILIQALSAYGADVTDATDTGDTPATRAALESGAIDAYFEYNSTGWTVHLGESERPNEDGEELTEEVRDRDASNGIVWVDRSTFNNTYGFALSAELAEEHQATRYSVEEFDLEDLAELIDDDDLTICIEADFETRADGLPLFESETGTTIPDDQLLVVADAAAVYEAVAADRCDVSEVFTTDGLIREYDLEVVTDHGVFYVYNVSLTIREEVYRQAPDEFDDLTDQILSPMSRSRITELNQRVELGEPVADVAEDFLDRFVLN